MTDKRISLRNDSSGAWTIANPILVPGEIGVETNTGRLKLGLDSATPWNSMGYTADSVGRSLLVQNLVRIFADKPLGEDIVIVGSGQSNAGGAGSFINTGDSVWDDNPNIWDWSTASIGAPPENAQDGNSVGFQWRQVGNRDSYQNTVRSDDGTYTGYRRNGSGQIGHAFADELQRLTGRTIRTIWTRRDGTNIADSVNGWLWGFNKNNQSQDGKTIARWSQHIDSALGVLRTLPGQSNIMYPDLALWIQGEANANNTTSGQYAGYMSRMISDTIDSAKWGWATLEKPLWVLYDLPGSVKIAYPDFNGHTQTRDLLGANRCFFIPTENAPLADTVHYSGPGTEILGRRGARNLATHMAPASTKSSGFNTRQVIGTATDAKMGQWIYKGDTAAVDGTNDATTWNNWYTHTDSYGNSRIDIGQLNTLAGGFNDILDVGLGLAIKSTGTVFTLSPTDSSAFVSFIVRGPAYSMGKVNTANTLSWHAYPWLSSGTINIGKTCNLTVGGGVWDQRSTELYGDAPIGSTDLQGDKTPYGVLSSIAGAVGTTSEFGHVHLLGADSAGMIIKMPNAVPIFVKGAIATAANTILAQIGPIDSADRGILELDFAYYDSTRSTNSNITWYKLYGWFDASEESTATNYITSTPLIVPVTINNPPQIGRTGNSPNRYLLLNGGGITGRKLHYTITGKYTRLSLSNL